MKKFSKGSYGYISARKKFALICTLLSFGVAAGIFVLGLALNNWEKGNVFTIIAAVLVIPAAKFLVSLIMFFPYKTVPKDQYDRVCALVQDEDVLFADVVLTSYEHVLNMAYMVLVGDKLFVLEGRDKEKLDFTKDYLQTTCRKKGFDVNVAVFAAGDEKMFSKAVQTASRFSDRGYSEEDMEALFKERDELLDLLTSMMP